MRLGILAFGSLIDDPGPELRNHIARTIPVRTPFPIEFARYSGNRGGAATLVPFRTGQRVSARLFELTTETEVSLATDMLYRRERHKYDGKQYQDPRGLPA